MRRARSASSVHDPATPDSFGRAYWDGQISRLTDACRQHNLQMICARIDLLTEQGLALVNGETPRRRGRARAPHAQDHADLVAHLKRVILRTLEHSHARWDPALRLLLSHSRVHARAVEGCQLLVELVQALKERDQIQAPPVDLRHRGPLPESSVSEGDDEEEVSGEKFI